MSDEVSVYRQAIDDGNGSVDAGYLALFTTMWMTVPLVTVVVLSGVSLAWAHPEKAGEVLQQTGIGAGAIAAAFATIVAAVGAFRMGDKPRVAVAAPHVNAQVAQVQQ